MDERVEVERIVATNKDAVDRLRRYLVWLREKTGKKVFETYYGDSTKKLSMSVPIYDGTLLNFINEVKSSGFVNDNYSYIYVKNHMKTAEDEKRMINRATILNMDTLWGILSYYTLKGMVKGRVWQEGIGNGVLEATVSKMCELIDFWSAPPQEKNTY